MVSRVRPTWGIGLVIGVLALGSAAVAFHYAAARQLRADLGRVAVDMREGRFALAREGLLRLRGRWPEDSEVQFRLGACELARDRPAAALEAWGRVPKRSPFAIQAALRSAEILFGQARFAEAEAVLAPVLRMSGPDVIPARHVFLLLLGQEGRLDEARSWIEQLWNEAGLEHPEERLALLKEHIALDLETFPLEGNLALLAGSSSARPDDDRAWLALAYLEVRRGRWDAAKTWLDACIEHRPNDPVVATAHLNWAVAVDNLDEVHRALRDVPPEFWSESRFLTLRAWLARIKGDGPGEAAALERLNTLEPGNTAAVGRLADLAAQNGDAERSRRLLRRLAELDDAMDRFRRLHKAYHLPDDAREMARLAERLGHWFQARALLDLLPANDPERRAALARLNRDEPPQVQSAATFAQQFATELATSRSRPTPSEAVSAATPRFESGSEGLGLAPFIFDNGTSAAHQLPEVMSGGLALLDYDGDGWLDVYAVQGGTFPPEAGRPHEGDRLFHNRGDGTFEDATAAAGIAAMRRGYGHGVATGDIDNDGHPDLFVTRWRSYALYRNRGDGTFEDVTECAGLGGDRDWPTSAAFADLDNDGDLDLYVCHYGVWDADHPRLCKDPSRTFNISCDPRGIAALPDHIFRNDGGRFVDVSREAAIVDTDGRGLGVIAADVDGDHRMDLFVANDSTANFLFRNLGGLRFEEVGHSCGVAANAQGGYQAGMGVACADIDGDRRADLLVTNFYDEGTTFYHNSKMGLFADRSADAGLTAASRFRLGFGIVSVDFNNDGWIDLMTANGHVSDMRPQFPFAMPPQLFIGTGRARLLDVTARAGPPFQQDYVGRGLAAGDLDNDGRVDAVMVAQGEPLVVFRNRTGGGHFLTLKLEGSESNRDGIGATATVTAGGRERVMLGCGGGSYQSASDARLHFGLGAETRAARVEVRWPSGKTDQYSNLAADTGYLLREGASTAQPLAGFHR